jgi:hypothetical protein
MNKFLGSVAALFLAMTGMAGVARAQQTQTQTSPGVARVSLMKGSVSMQRGDSGEWVAVTVNTPLLTGDTISTGPNSRAEVQLDYANVLRLGSNSTAKIANLDRKTIQVQVAQGLVNYDVLVQDEAQAEIDTPNVAIHPLGNGRYRIEVDPNNQSLLTVVKGEADVSTPQGSTRVEQGQLITIQGINNPQYRVTNAGPEDSWDAWNRDRDSKIYNSSVWRHTDRYYTGAQDLEPYGRWVYASDYGWVWVPTDVGPGWAPYRNGRWVWEPYYGWTWVSYEPWGWAPFHYGRWFLYAGNWSWWPGPINMYPGYYPVWSPAYVSFFGFGYSGVNFSIGFGFGFGNVGWWPIGPGDCYYPWYGRGRRFRVFGFRDYDRYRDYHRYHGWAPLYHGRHGHSNFDKMLTDHRLRKGVSWMRADRFGRAPVPRQRREIDGAAFRKAKMFSGRVPVMPTKASLRVVNRAPNRSSYRPGVMKSQRFFTAGHPAPRPTSFREQRAQLQRSMQEFRKQGGVKAAGNGQPFGTNQRVRTGVARQGNQPFGGASAKSRNNWQRFGGQARQPVDAKRGTFGRNGARPVQQGKGAVSQRPGWHTFNGAVRASGNKGAWARQGGQAQPRGNNGSRGSSPVYRNQAPAQRQRQPRQGGWQTFKPSTRPSQPAQRGGNGRTPAQRQGWKVFNPSSSRQPRNAPAARGGQSSPRGRQGGWQVFRPSSRPSSRGGNYRRNSGRQPLNLRQPIVQRHQSSPYGGRRGYRAPSDRNPGRAPSYRAPRGNRGGYSRGGSSRGGGFNRGGSSRGGGRGSARGGSRGGGRSSGGHPHGGGRRH